MNFRVVASVLLLLVLAALVYMTETDGAAIHPVLSESPPAGLSADDKAMKTLKID